MSKLALGTVQFGLPYGIANKKGQVGLEEASKILERAFAAGIDTLDTAIAYGDSEKVLGKIGVDQWKIVSKLPAVPDNFSNTREVTIWVQEQLSESLRRLRVKSLYGILLHNPKDLVGPWGEAIFKALLDLRAQNKFQKIGVSVYSPEELNPLFLKYSFDLVQAPFNVFDRRLQTSGWLQKLYGMQVEVHARSIFLQGLLLMSPDERPEKFRPWTDLFLRWHAWLNDMQITPLQASLSYILLQPEISKVLVGIDSYIQFQELLTVLDTPSYFAPPDAISTDCADLIHPSRWGRL